MTQCFTCEINLQDTQTKAILYQCGMCKEKTPYCLKCSHILIKLLSSQVFKCYTCNSITKIISKEEVIFTNSNNIRNTALASNSGVSSVSPQQCFFSLETPNKPTMLSHQQQQHYNYMTPRNNSFMEEKYIEDFNKITFMNPNEDEDLQKSFMNMTSNKRNVTPVRNMGNSMSSMKLTLSNGPEQKSEFAGYNRKGKKNNITLRRIPIQQEMISCNSNSNIMTMENRNVIPIPIQKINFKRGYDESNKPRFGVKCTLGDNQLNNTFHLPNLTPSSFKFN